MEDPNNGISGYNVRSLYFDTLYNNDYQEKIDGIGTRKKIRLRVYDPDSSYAMLEMKQKQGDAQKKRSLKIDREDAKSMINGNYSVLLKYADSFATECYGYMTMKLYRPKAIVEYHRKAFIARENKTRITLDSHIVATETNHDIFSENLSVSPVLDVFNAVLEVKYNGFLLSYIKDVLQLADKSPLAVSKYCLARSSTLKYKF